MEKCPLLRDVTPSFYMLIFSSLLELRQKKIKVSRQNKIMIKGKENNNKGSVIKGLNTFLTIPNAYSLSV